MASVTQSPLLLSANSAVVEDDPEVLAGWKSSIATNRAAVFPDILEPRFGKMIQSLCANAQLEEQEVEGVGRRWVEPLDKVGKVLSLVLSNDAVLHWMSEFAGQGPVNKVAGRLASYPAGAGELLGWHDDNFEGRRIAVVIGLSEHPYGGGEFQLRKRDSKEIVFEHQLQGFGSALIFHIGNDVEHRLRPVSAGGPRTTFAGWFFDQK